MVSPDRTPKAVQDCHDLLAWLVPRLDGFPRTRRYTLGARIEDSLLDVLRHLVRAAYQRDKRESLAAANLELEVARHLWRVAHELEAMPAKRFAHGAKLIDDLGRQIGGWLRSRAPAESDKRPL